MNRKVTFARGAGAVELSGGRGIVTLAGEPLGVVARLASGSWTHGRDRSRHFSSPEAAAEDLAAGARGDVAAMTKRQLADALTAIEVSAGRLANTPGDVAASVRRLLGKYRHELAARLEEHRATTAPRA